MKRTSRPPSGLGTADALFKIFGMHRAKVCCDCSEWNIFGRGEEELPFCWKKRKCMPWDSKPCKSFKEN